MSQFLCINGHQLSCFDTKCPVCDMPLFSMDGMTERELVEREADEFNYLEEDAYDNNIQYDI